MKADGTADDMDELPKRRKLSHLPAEAEVLPPQERGAVFATGGFDDGPGGPVPVVSLSLATGTVNIAVQLGEQEVDDLRAQLEEALADARDTTEAVREADDE
jgi:hypothetical protein